MKKSTQGDKGSFQLPGQTDKNLSTTSQPSLSRLSSFNFSKMLYSVMPASENAHTREEVRGSPALMRNILDSLPDNPVSVSHSSAKMDPESIAAAKARKQARMEVRQGIIVLDKITQKLAKMMGYSILPTQKVEEPQVASKSVVEKLPPITRTQHPVNMTTAPVEWSNERSSMSNQKPEEKAEPTEPVKAKTVSEAAAPKQCTQCGAPGGGTVMKLTAAEHRAIRRAKIQAKIAELEKAKNAELQKLQEIETSESIELESPQLDKEATAREQVDESTEEVVSAEAEEAEDIKAGEADIAESEKEARIAVEKKMKLAKYEAARIAEIERAKNEMEKMAEPKQLKMEEEEKGSDELEHPEVAEVNVSGGDAVLEGEATIAKERETALAEYDSIIKSSTDHRIAQLEQAKMEREAARIAALDPAEREKEIARMAELRQAVIKKDASVEDGLQKPEETEIDESKERAELERQARISQERKANLAEYEQVINTVTEWRIAQLEQAKKDLEADRIAKLDPVEREKETARLAEMQQTKRENEADEFESIEGAENDESAGEDELLAERELTASEEELAESFVEPKVSHPRPPTPPPQHAAALHSHTSLFGPQTSLRTITEGGTCDFTPEFASPLTTHSFHAIVPYQSFRTRFGLRNHETMSDRQLGEEMRKLSHATMMVQNEILKRKRSKDTAIDPTIDSTTDETSGTQRKVYPECSVHYYLTV